MKLIGKRKKDEINFFDGKWKSIELIGEGSYGKVYKAIKSDHGITTYSAIKVIKVPQHESEIQALRREGMNTEEIKKYYQKFVDKWLDEIKLMQNLKDSINVVKIEDYEVIEDNKKINWEIVIRMELLENVEDYFKDKEITHKDILKLGLDMAKALDSCNKSKIIHRDIKPDNIFISSKGDYKLGDFGIARTLEKTTSGLSKKGTYNYMAPEVYKGDRYNHTVDIYSLGLVMYRYFNYNRTPLLPNYPEEITYEDREESILQRMSGELIPSPMNADEEEAKIILKAMAFNPKDRYKNALEMIVAIEPLVKNKKYEMVLPKLTSKDEKKFNKTKTNKEKVVDIFTEKEKLDKTQSIFDESTSKEIIEKHNKTISIFENESDKVKKESSKKSSASKVKKEKVLDKTQSIFANDAKEDKFRKTMYPVGLEFEKTHHDKTISIFEEEPKKEDKRIKDIVEEREDRIYKEENGLNKVFNNKENEVIDELKEEKIPKVKVKDISNQEKKKKKRLLIIFIIILLIILLFIGSFIYFKINYVEVPNLVGKDSQEAIDILDENNLIEKVETRITENEKEVGKVLKQTKQGKIVKKETIITIVVGVSENKVKMINVVGKNIETAKKELGDLGLVASITEEYNDKYAEGIVISQTIAENEKVNKGTTVELLVSKGSKKKEETKTETKKEESKKEETKKEEPKKEESKKPTVVNPTSISITSSITYIEKGSTYQFAAKVLPTNATNKSVVWSSSNSSIVSIDKNGVITGVGNSGSATITATVSNTKLKATHTVYVYRLGDANGDGVITEEDAKYALELYKFDSASEFEKLRADVNKDGLIDSADAAKIYQIIKYQ